MSRIPHSSRAASTVIGVALLAALMGCSQSGLGLADGALAQTGMTIAVAPVLNFSGRHDFDPVHAADLLASELIDLGVASVLPVNRVVAALALEGRGQIESPAHAVRIAEAVGADAILVAGITEYNAYTPIVGLSLQMYTLPALGPHRDYDAIEASRQSRPVSMEQLMRDPSLAPLRQIQATYNAMHEDVVKRVRSYAEPRCADDDPYGWRRYLVAQEMYLRFCWHDALTRLLSQPVLTSGRAVRGAGGMPA